MKNIYELPEEEKSKLRDEFNKLPFTKKVNKTRMAFFYAIFILLFVIGVLTGAELIAEGSFLENLLGYLFDFSIVLFIFYTIYLNICFYRWMKVKHKIEH